jgi:uncharacterized coiled-coil DUF342 family protein
MSADLQQKVLDTQALIDSMETDRALMNDELQRVRERLRDVRTSVQTVRAHRCAQVSAQADEYAISRERVLRTQRSEGAVLKLQLETVRYLAMNAVYA